MGINIKFKITDFKKGAAALITILSIGSLLFTISLTSSMLVYYANQNIYSFDNSLKTYYAAYSGIQEALLRLERDKKFNNNLTLNINGTNDVSISILNYSSSATIISTSTYNLVNTAFQTVVDIATTTSLITPTSTSELSL